MRTPLAHTTFALLLGAGLAACAGNPAPEDTAAADTTAATAGVMAAPKPDSARDTTMMPPPRDTAAAIPSDTTMKMPADTSMAMPAAAAAATAQMHGIAGRDFGTLTLTETSGGIAISGTLAGLPPGEHGFHVHAVGTCEGPSFETAGAHWNPTNRAHGMNNPAGPHLGDLPNLTVAADSSVTVQATTPGGTLHGENSMLDDNGAALVIHAAADDYKSNPSGNSGNRIACGVVKGGM
jgi:Cu-Zn family superoxide dismutase